MMLENSQNGERTIFCDKKRFMTCHNMTTQFFWRFRFTWKSLLSFVAVKHFAIGKLLHSYRKDSIQSLLWITKLMLSLKWKCYNNILTLGKVNLCSIRTSLTFFLGVSYYLHPKVLGNLMMYTSVESRNTFKKLIKNLLLRLMLKFTLVVVISILYPDFEYLKSSVLLLYLYYLQCSVCLCWSMSHSAYTYPLLVTQYSTLMKFFIL